MSRNARSPSPWELRVGDLRIFEATVKEQILSDLERLSPEMQARAAKLVHELVTATPRGTPGRDLLRFAGMIDAESVREMEEAIEDGCEGIDPEEW